MTADAFLASLPRDPAIALEQVKGALSAEVIDPHWSPQERQAVLAEKYRLEVAMRRSA